MFASQNAVAYEQDVGGDLLGLFFILLLVAISVVSLAVIVSQFKSNDGEKR